MRDDPLADAAALLPGNFSSGQPPKMPQRARKPIDQAPPIIKPHDMQAFFGQWRATIIEAPNPERAWHDCAADFRRRVRTMEIGRAAAADELDKIIHDQSLFAGASTDENQSRIAAALADPGPQQNHSHANGHDTEPPTPSPEDYGISNSNRALTVVSEAQPHPLTFLDPSNWDGRTIPPRRWLIPHRIPLGNVTMLNGDGAAGKTTIALQLVVATPRGAAWLGSQVDEPGPAIFLTAEEDEDEIHRRIAAILDHQGLAFRELAGVHLLCRPGADVVLGIPDRFGIIHATPLFERLSAAAEGIRPSLIVIEAAADVFAGNENDRAQVRQFIALLRRLALTTGAAVVLIAHPSLTGLSTGTGTSGSTAWNNSVRSRLYFTGAKKADDDESDIRELKVMKSNYGPAGEIVRLRWDRGVFVPEGGPGMIERVAAEAAVDAAYLDCLDATLGSGRQVGPYPGKAYAPAIFEKMTQAKGHRAKALAAAQERLFNGRIEVVKIGPPSKALDRIARKSSVAG